MQVCREVYQPGVGIWPSIRLHPSLYPKAMQPTFGVDWTSSEACADPGKPVLELMPTQQGMFAQIAREGGRGWQEGVSEVRRECLVAGTEALCEWLRFMPSK